MQNKTTTTSTTIRSDFFKGENIYRQQNGQIARNVLRRDYQKFLYQNNLPREFDQQELEAMAKSYVGPVEQEAIKSRAKLAQNKPKIKKYAPKDWSFMDNLAN